MAKPRVGLKEVYNTGHKGSLGPYDDHLDIVAEDEIGDSVKIIDFDIDISGTKSSASIARCDKKLGAQWALCNLMGESVFAAARTKNEDTHKQKE